jgi:hypothetical protein
MALRFAQPDSRGGCLHVDLAKLYSVVTNPVQTSLFLCMTLALGLRLSSSPAAVRQFIFKIERGLCCCA